MMINFMCYFYFYLIWTRDAQIVGKTLFLFLKNVYFLYLTLPGLCCSVRDLQLWHVGSSSLTRD